MRDRTLDVVPAAPVTTPASASTDLKRRRFLLSLGAGGVSAAAVAIAAAPTTAVALEPTAPADGGDSGYRETDHVRDYYGTTRI